MGQSFGQSFGDSFSKTLPNALQLKVQLDQAKQLRDFQAGFQVENQAMQYEKEAGEVEKTGDYATASALRIKANNLRKDWTTQSGSHASALDGILSQIPQSILHPIQAAQKVKSAFTRTPQQPVQPTTQAVQQPVGTLGTAPDNADPGINPNWDATTKANYLREKAKTQQDIDTGTAVQKTLPKELGKKLSPVINNPNIKLEDKLNFIEKIGGVQDKLLPRPDDTKQLDAGVDVVNDIRELKKIVRRNPNALGIDEVFSTPAANLQGSKLTADQKDRQAVSVLLRRLKNSVPSSRGGDDWLSKIFGAGGLPSPAWNNNPESFINELDNIEKQTIGDFNRQFNRVEGQGQETSGFKKISREKIPTGMSSSSMADNVQPTPTPNVFSIPPVLKDFKNPKKVQSMIDAGIIDFKSAGKLIMQAGKAVGAALEQPVQLKKGGMQDGVPGETQTLPNGTEIIWRGSNAPSKQKKTQPVVTTQKAQPSVAKPGMVQQQSFPNPQPPSVDPVEQELKQYYKDGTEIKGRPGKGNLSEAPKPGSQAHFINTLAKTQPTLKTIVTLANTLKKSNGAGVNKQLISQLDRDGATLLDLALAYLENEGQPVG